MKKDKIVKKAVIDTLKEKSYITTCLIISIIAGVIMQLIPPQVMRYIIDNHISKGIEKGIWTLALCYLGSVILSAIADFIRELTMTSIGQGILANIRYNMGKKLFKLPSKYLNNNPVGTIMSYFTSDVDAIGTILTSGVIGIIADGMKAIGIIISLYIISPTLAIIVTILIPVIYMITNSFNKITLKAQMEARNAVGKINGYIEELFNGIRIIKLFGEEGEFLRKLQKPLNDNLDAVHKTSSYDSIFPCIMQMIKAIIIVVIVVISSPKGVGILGLTIGSIASCVDLVSRMLAPIEDIATEFQTIQESISGLKRINEFENLDEEIRYDKNQKEVLLDIINDQNFDIKFKNVTFYYDNTNAIIKDMSFKIENGKKVALVGRTGAGKSTVLNLIAGLYKPSLGEIKIGGFNPFTIPANLRRRIIGIVPQNNIIYDGTVKDVITLNDDNITEEEVINVCRMIEIHDDIMKLSNGYNTEIGEGKEKLSNGQYQLLSIASAIVVNPPVLLLDEVTSGLDTITEKRIFKILQDISGNRTILTISHRISGIIDADEVIVIKDGLIEQKGTPIELSSNEGWYSKYTQVEELGWKI